jgi:hypothetical protein
VKILRSDYITFFSFPKDGFDYYEFYFNLTAKLLIGASKSHYQINVKS